MAPLTLESIEAAIAEVQAMPPPVLLLVLHSQVDFYTLLQNAPAPPSVLWGFNGELNPMPGPEIMIEPEFNLQPKTYIGISDPELVRSVKAFHGRAQERRLARAREELGIPEPI